MCGVVRWVVVVVVVVLFWFFCCCFGVFVCLFGLVFVLFCFFRFCSWWWSERYPFYRSVAKEKKNKPKRKVKWQK